MVTVEFSGGLEEYFDKPRYDNIELQEGATVEWLIKDFLKPRISREDVLLQDDTIRPGILVLINDLDWEILDEESYVLNAGDHVLLASTLHGG